MRVVKPTDKELNSWIDRFSNFSSELTSRLDAQLSRRDRRAAEKFALAVAIHVGTGGTHDLEVICRNGATKSKFERGRRAFSRVFPGDPFAVVRQIGLVDSYSGMPDASARQMLKVFWKRIHEDAPVERG